MPVLIFSLAPHGVGQVSDILACLAKLDENVFLEATPQRLQLSTLNQSKTAHAAFNLDASGFFIKYHFSLDAATEDTPEEAEVWSCKVLNKALLSVFRKRLADGRDKETALERLEFELEHGTDNDTGTGTGTDQAECRLVLRLVCTYGVVKTYRIYYQSDQVLHASFDSQASTNYWTVPSWTLRHVVEYFGPKTEQLDWFFHDGRVTFTSYTEKIQSGREILKQPTHTSVALEGEDFSEVDVQEGLHIGIVVKDFRTIVAHAETMRVEVTARYSHGNRPMQLSYDFGGLHAEFTLMTRATSESASFSVIKNSTPSKNLFVPIAPVQTRQQRRHYQKQQQRDEKDDEDEEDDDEPGNAAVSQNASQMPPPPPPLARLLHEQPRIRPPISRGNSRESPPAPSASVNPDSLFIPADDDDEDGRWDEPNFDEEQDIVTWDHKSAAASLRRVHDAGVSESLHNDSLHSLFNSPAFHEIEPTQRLSQVKGLFD